MAFRRVLFHTTFLSGLALGATASLAGPLDPDIIVDNGVDRYITTQQTVANAWVGVDNPDQFLEVTADGWIVSSNAAIGINADSDGNTAVVQGKWDQNGGFIIGNLGSGNALDIEDGGTVTATSLTEGVFAGADGNGVTVDGQNGQSTLVVSGAVTVGDASSSNTLTVESGGKVSDTLAYVGYGAGSTGNTVTVEGTGSEWTTDFTVPDTGVLYLGLDGNGNTMNVLDGGAATVAKDMLLGANAGADDNTLDIAGDGSKVTVGGMLYVGRSSEANSVVVESGGNLETTGARIGGGTGSVAASSGNTVTVEGAGSTWVDKGSLRIGDGSVQTSTDNKLIIKDGGTVTLANGDATFIGRTALDSGNQLIVTGAGSSFNTSGIISVGKLNDSPDSRLIIDDGGIVKAGGVGVGNGSGVYLGYSADLETTTLVLADTSRLSVTLDDARPSTVNVSTDALLDGALVAVISPGGLTANRYEVLSAGNISGTFNALTLDGAGANYAAVLDYSLTDVSLLFTAQLGAGTSLNRNQQNVATVLDGDFNAGGTLTPEIASLYGLTGSALTSALSEVSGEAGASGGVNAIERATTSFLGLMLGGGGQAAAQGSARQASAVMNSGVVPTADVPAVQGGWSVWGGVYGGAANLPGDSASGSHDTDTNVEAIATGWDRDVSPDTRVGLAIAGGRTGWKLDSGLGSGDSTFLQLGGYGTQHFGSSYLTAGAAYAWHSLSTDRTVNVDGSEKLKADFDAGNLSGRIEAGHRFAAGEQLGLTPYAAFQAQAVYMPGYREHGGGADGGFALDYSSNTATALRSEVGFGIDTALGLDPAAAKLFGRLAWAHDWTSDASVQASFLGLDASAFTVNGAAAPANIALVTAGAEFSLSEATTLAATFDGEFGADYQSYAGSATLRYSF